MFAAVSCFFLLHEMPAQRRRDIVASLRRTVRPAGKVVCVGYHRPRAWLPLKPLTSLVFDTLEPFAKARWHEGIAAMAAAVSGFTRTERTRFGGLDPKVVAVARCAAAIVRGRGGPNLLSRRPVRAATGSRIGDAMFIAMNRFRVRRGKEEDFERVWLERDSYLKDVPGFVAFHLLRGPTSDEHTLFASHTVWRSREDMEAWTRSEAFRAAHAGAGDTGGLYLDRPQFEGFDVLQEVR